MSTQIDRLGGPTGDQAVKAPCVVATTAKITLSGLKTSNGVTVAAGDRVLVKSQTTTTQNGIYNASTGSWTRATDFDGARDVVQGTLVVVVSASGSGSMYRVTTANPIVFGSSNITFDLSAFSVLDAASVSVIQSGTGAVSRTVQDKVRERLCVFDFMTTTQIADVRAGTVAQDVTTAIQNCIDYAVSLGSATIYFPGGTYKVTSSIINGDRVGNVAKSVSFIGDGALSTKIYWAGSTSGTMLKWWKNKYSKCYGMGFVNGVSKGTTIGLILTGNAAGTQSNNLIFENCAWLSFDSGFYCGGGSLGTEAASEVNFISCDFETNNTGFLGAGSGNTLNVWFRGCAFTANTNYGADLGSAGCCHFWGCGSHANGVAAVRCTAAWQSTLHIDGFRAELTSPEIFLDTANCGTVIVQNCLFLNTAGGGLAYDIIKGSPVFLGIYACTFGVATDSGWRVFGNDSGLGASQALDMRGNIIYGTNPFTINGGSGGIDGMQYSLSGNYYNSVQHGVEEGKIVWPNRSPDRLAGTVTLSSGTAAVSLNPRESTYRVALAGQANDKFWVSAKSSGGFTINAATTASTAIVEWSLSARAGSS